MAGNVKLNIHRRVKQDFFKIVFYGSDSQAISFFGDKQCRSQPAVMELITHGKVLAKDVTQLAVDVQRAWLIALSDDGDHVFFKVDIFQADAMNFAHTQAELIHQGIDGVVAKAQNRVGIDLF